MPTLWEGRFDGEPDEAFRQMNNSISFDLTMYREDIRASKAHVTMLARVGLIDEDELSEILDALVTTEQEITDGTFEFAESDEDVHTAVERRVTELTPAGGKLHTARSRNDQVVTDLRLWTKHSLQALIEGTVSLMSTLLEKAIDHVDDPVAGYTHLQRGQPISLAHYLLAHGWALSRDVERMVDAARRVDVSPLGAGALAGTSLPIDPSVSAAEMGFGAIFENSIDAVSDRDFVAETLFAISMLGVHISRLGEDLVIWASSEFGFATIDDRFASGSSMMPQKHNPDIAELARGKAGRLIGNLVTLLTALKGLPLTYNKDLQEDKEPLFDSVHTMAMTLAAVDGMLSTVTFETERMREAASSPLVAATDLAEWMVERGTPFRSAHAIVGGLVRKAIEGADLAELVAAHEELGPEALPLLEEGASLRRRRSHGGAAPEVVRTQIERFEQKIASLSAE